MKLAKDRLYYSISDVAEILDLKPSIIRFWETEFALLKPLQKEKNAKRKFKIREIEILLKIKTLLYLEKFTIKGANDQLRNWKPGMTFQEISEALENGVIPLSAGQEGLFDTLEDEESVPERDGRPVQVGRNQDRQQIFEQIAEIRALLGRIK